MTMNQCTMETRYKTTTKKESSKTIIVINEDKDTTYIDIHYFIEDVHYTDFILSGFLHDVSKILSN